MYNARLYCLHIIMYLYWDFYNRNINNNVNTNKIRYFVIYNNLVLRVKTYLRSSLSNEKTSQLWVLCMEAEITKNID